MRFLIALAWKNLSRYRRRTIITALAIAVGLGVYLWMDAWIYGVKLDSQRNLVFYEMGAAKVMKASYWKDLGSFPLKESIENLSLVEERLRPLGVQMTRRVPFSGEVFLGEGSLFIRLEGIDPVSDGRLFRLKESVEQGRYLQPGEQGLLIGAGLAKDLKAALGDLITVRCRTRQGAFQTFDLEVVGILNSPNPQVNRRYAYLPLSLVDEMLQMEGRVTELVLFFSGWDRPEQKVEQIKTALADLPGLAAVSWKLLASDYFAALRGDTIGNTLMLFLVFIIAAVGISNTMLMAVMERHREVGMMRALGMKDGQIRLSFLLEAAGIGLIGALGGLALGAALSFWIVTWGVDYSSLLEGMDDGSRVKGLMRGAWHPEAFAGAFIFALLVSMVFSFIPTGRAVRMQIAACLRSQ